MKENPACDRRTLSHNRRADKKIRAFKKLVLYSCGANTKHGFRRSPGDTQRAVLRLLDDGEWCKWSDRKIAETCRVSQQFVSRLRNIYDESRDNQLSRDNDEKNLRVGKDGKTYDVSKIQEANKKRAAKVTTSETTTKEVHEYPVETDFVEWNDEPKTTGPFEPVRGVLRKEALMCCVGMIRLRGSLTARVGARLFTALSARSPLLMWR